MNILSHYYIDRQHPSVNYKLGVIFPDIFRGFNKELRQAVFNSTPQNQFEQEFIAGIHKHYHVDRVFHNLPFFMEYDALLKEAILSHTDLRQRVFFLSHIYLEMLIDRLLIAKNTELLASFYGDLRTVDLKGLDLYLGRMQKQDSANEFFGKFNLFKKARYLYRYSNHESFVLTALNIYERVCNVAFTHHHVQAMMEITARIEQQHANELLSVFDVMNKALESPHEK